MSLLCPWTCLWRVPEHVADVSLNVSLACPWTCPRMCPWLCRLVADAARELKQDCRHGDCPSVPNSDQLVYRRHAGLTRRRRNILFPSGVKLCTQETLDQAIANHLNYFHLRGSWAPHSGDKKFRCGFVFKNVRGVSVFTTRRFTLNPNALTSLVPVRGHDSLWNVTFVCSSVTASLRPESEPQRRTTNINIIHVIIVIVLTLG